MSTHSSDDEQRVALLAEKIRSIPDKLVSMQIDLRPLCTQEVHGLPAEARRKIAAACDVLQSAIGDLQTVLEYVVDWEAADRSERCGQQPRRAVSGAGVRAPREILAARLYLTSSISMRNARADSAAACRASSASGCRRAVCALSGHLQEFAAKIFAD